MAAWAPPPGQANTAKVARMDDAAAAGRFHPQDVPRLRRDMIAYLTGDLALPMQAHMIRIGKQGLAPILGGSAEQQALMLITDETNRWRNADLFYVAAPMVDVALAAYATLPDVAPTADMFPAPWGVMVFGKPLVSRPMEPDEFLTARSLAGRELADNWAATSPTAEVIAAAWGPFSGGETWGSWAERGLCGDWSVTGGMWINFYTGQGAMFPTGQAQTQNLRNLGIPELNPENEVAFALMPPPELLPPGKSEANYLLRAAEVEDTTAGWARALLATFLMMKQPMVATTADPVPRPERRRAQKAGLPAPSTVQLVNVRHPERTTEPMAPADEQHAARQRHHSWVVRGFWRNHWYASQAVHRPVWIAPHVRGPADKPLIGAEKVQVWNR